MDEKLLMELNRELKIVERQISNMKRHEEVLEGRSEMILRPSCRAGGRIYYSAKAPGNSPSIYLGNASNVEVKRIREAHVVREFLAEATEYSEKLRALIAAAKPLNLESINQNLPKTYRLIGNSGQNSMIDGPGLMDDRAVKWLKDKRAEKEVLLQQYPDKHEYNLKHTGMDGAMYRSKSEMDIADALFLCGIPYIYELPVELSDGVYRFDFRCLSLYDYKSEIIIEHQGMMERPGYQQKFMNTLKACLNNGITPNVNIFFTFDDMQGNADTRQIKFIIDSVLLPPKDKNRIIAA